MFFQLITAILLLSMGTAQSSTLTESTEEPRAYERMSMERMSHLLSETDDLRSAYKTSRSLVEYLKNEVDFSSFPLDLFSDERARATLLSLIRVEQFKILETEHGSLRRVDPTIMDYYDLGQTRFKSQAILLSLVSVVQNSLHNPETDIADLIRLLRYQKNSRHLSRGVRDEMTRLFEDGSIRLLITAPLVEAIQRSSLVITGAQVRRIAEESARQQLSSYELPILRLFTEPPAEKALFPMRYFGSSVDGLQCGFFSLGFSSRRQATEQILDNLAEDDIYHLADRVSAESGRVRQTLARLFEGGEMSHDSRHYLKLYAKRNGLDPAELETLDRLRADYQDLAQKMKEKEEGIDQEFEEFKKTRGLPAIVPADDDGTIASQFCSLRKPFEHRKGIEQTQFSKLIYALADFQKFIEKDITKKFSGGQLEFDPNPEWQSDVLSYPKIMAILNNQDIYCWVSRLSLMMMQREAQDFIIEPIDRTADGEFFLVNFIIGGPNAKRMDLLNLGGGHFEKWVSDVDFPRLASAIRHKSLYGLPDTASYSTMHERMMTLLKLLTGLEDGSL